MTQFLSAKHKTNGSLYSSINEELDKVPTSPIYELIIACLYNVYTYVVFAGQAAGMGLEASFHSMRIFQQLAVRHFSLGYLEIYIYICMLTNVRWKKAERIYVVFGAVIEIINAAISI